MTNLDSVVDGPSVPAGTTAGFNLQGLSNFNAADIDPVSGHLIVGNVRPGTYNNGSSQLTRLLRIGVTTTPPQLVGVTELSPAIPAGSTGDIAVDATGTYVYGMARQSGSLSHWWRADLASGAVDTLQTHTSGLPSFGGIELMNDGNFALFGNPGNVLTVNAAGDILSTGTLVATDSSDAARCLPPPPQPVAVPTVRSGSLALLSTLLAAAVSIAWSRRRRKS